MQNQEVALVAAGTTTTKTASLSTGGFRSLICIVKGSAGAGSVDVVISGESASGVGWSILDSGAVSGTTAKVLRVSPDLTAAANSIAQDLMPDTISVTATVTGSYTYGVDVSLGS